MIGLLLLLVSPLALYWVIRLAVRHGIEDAQQRRADHSVAEAADENAEAVPSGALWVWHRLLGAFGWLA
ncbi:MAG TPA: hypothetical protein VEV45_03180 [Streptosporangiaceae bacterium]|nr:hypothetical protein [Streptosporangiaceae bacterium]